MKTIAVDGGDADFLDRAARAFDVTPCHVVGINVNKEQADFLRQHADGFRMEVGYDPARQLLTAYWREDPAR